MIVEIEPSIVLYEKKIQNLCRVPYHGHPKGCPNYGKNPGCPPHDYLIDGFFDMNDNLFIIYSAFNIGEFAERMRQTHPPWEGQPRQWYNPRRWQGSARKKHAVEFRKFIDEYPNLVINNYPEAFGVNISDMMSKIGINLSWNWPPEHELNDDEYLKNLDYRVALGGTPLNDSITHLLGNVKIP